jgi:hypothetical protein
MPDPANAGERTSYRRCGAVAYSGLFASSVKPSRPERWFSFVVSKHPDSNALGTDIVKKVVGESVKIASSQPRRIEMERSRVLASLGYANLELSEKILSKLS